MMRGQWNLIFSLLIAILIAVFAVINVNSVRVNYLFGTAEWPLILVILGSVLMGSVIAGALGMMKNYHLQAEIKRLRANVDAEQGNVINDEESNLSRQQYRKGTDE